MNIFFLVAGVLLLIAFTVHFFVGDREYRRLRPAEEAHFSFWLTGRCTFHMASIDLLLPGIYLCCLGMGVTAYFFPLVLFFLFMFSGYLLSWLLTVKISDAHGKEYLKQGQWLLFLLVCVLLLCGVSANGMG